MRRCLMPHCGHPRPLVTPVCKVRLAFYFGFRPFHPLTLRRLPCQNGCSVVSVEWNMLRVSLPPILRWAALCGYALLVLLGHGGWHLVLGEACCGSHACHAGHPQTRKVTCSHGHVHTVPVRGSTDSEPDQSPAPPVPHDSDHCAVCAVFSAPLTLVEVVEVSVGQVEAVVLVAWHHELVSSTQERLPSPRGPPVG